MKTAMDLAYIREFVALASSLSFSETAEQMHISQSALSRHIQALEKELGEPLFIRSTRKMRIPFATRILSPTEISFGRFLYVTETFVASPSRSSVVKVNS